MDFALYTAKGFSEYWDAALADMPVAGIDRDQASTCIRVCPETEWELYHGSHSPQRIRYRRGSRPRLEAIVQPWLALSPRDRVAKAMEWTHWNVPHSDITRWVEPDRAMTEEQLIDSGVGWCNEMARVLIALCAVTEIPGRMCFLFHADGKKGHACAELFIEGKWTFHDPSFNLSAELPDGSLASGQDLSSPQRDLAHRLYRPAMAKKTAMFKSHVKRTEEDRRQFIEVVGDLFHKIGITNYLVEGAEPIREPQPA